MNLLKEINPHIGKEWDEGSFYEEVQCSVGVDVEFYHDFYEIHGPV